MANRRGSHKGSQAKKQATASSKATEDIVYDPTEYIVEKIIGKKSEKGRIMLLLKWKDYPVEKATWEPLVSCANCLPLLDEFEYNLCIEDRRRKKILSEARSASKNKPKRAKSQVKIPTQTRIMDSAPTTSKYSIDKELQKVLSTGVVKPISPLPSTPKAIKMKLVVDESSDDDDTDDESESET